MVTSVQRSQLKIKKHLTASLQLSNYQDRPISLQIFYQNVSGDEKKPQENKRNLWIFIILHV